jgi:hypothetical protein
MLSTLSQSEGSVAPGARMVEPGLARCRKRYAEDFDAFSFCLVSKSSRKTAQCCLEKHGVRAIERRTPVNSLPEGSPAHHEQFYESEKRTELAHGQFW